MQFRARVGGSGRDMDSLSQSRPADIELSTNAL
jgi:hypothetical protein